MTGPTLIEIRERIEAATVSVVAPLTEPELAVIVVMPTVMLVASPLVVTVATVVFEEVQPAWLRVCMLPSL